MLAGERLDGCRGVHVGHGNSGVGDAGGLQAAPCGIHLVGSGHIGHRAARRHVRQHDELVGRSQDVSALGHEVHAAEHDELAVGLGRGLLRQLEGVSGHIGELNDLIALVVVSENEGPLPEGFLGGLGTPHESGVAGGWKGAGAVNTALAEVIGAIAQQQHECGGFGLGKRVRHVFNGDRWSPDLPRSVCARRTAR